MKRKQLLKKSTSSMRSQPLSHIFGKNITNKIRKTKSYLQIVDDFRKCYVVPLKMPA